MTHRVIRGETALRVLLTLDDMRKRSEELDHVLLRPLMVRHGILYDRMLPKAWAELSVQALEDHKFCEYTAEVDTGKIAAAMITINGIEAAARVRSLAKRSQFYLELLPPREQQKHTNVVDFIGATRSHLRPATA